MLFEERSGSEPNEGVVHLFYAEAYEGTGD